MFHFQYSHRGVGPMGRRPIGAKPLSSYSIIPFGETPKFILLFYETYLCQEKHALVDRPPCVGIQTRLPLDISLTCLTKPPG